MAAVAFGIYYYLEHHKKPVQAAHEDYVWVGQGEHPLKEMGRDEVKKK